MGSAHHCQQAHQTPEPRFHALSRCAYFSISFFNPNRGNCTVILAFSPSPSRRYTTPSPYFGCFTRCPGRKELPPAAFSTGICGRLNFLPREAKQSAILSMELYLGPVYPPFDPDPRKGGAVRGPRGLDPYDVTLWSSSS